MEEFKLQTAAAQDKGQEDEGAVISLPAPLRRIIQGIWCPRGKEAIKVGARGGVTHQVFPYALNLWKFGLPQHQKGAYHCLFTHSTILSVRLQMHLRLS